MNSKLHKRPRLSDIAHALGVSISTVSRSLANDTSISAEVRAQVQRCATDMGYMARDAMPFGGMFLALMTSDHASGALGVFYEDILASLRETAADAGGRLDVQIVMGEDTDAVLDHVGEPAALAGVFFVGIDPAPAAMAVLRQAEVAMVGVNCIDPAMQIDSVSPANFRGAYCATQALLDAGHRTLVHITQAHRPTIHDRIRGFEAAIAADSGAQGSVIVLPRIRPAHVEAREALAAALRADPELSGAFCMNDVMALGAIEAVTGHAAPQRRFGVVGFDDLPLASMTRPRLATMAVDRQAMGREAWRLMRQRLATGKGATSHTEIAVRLVEGASLSMTCGAK